MPKTKVGFFCVLQDGGFPVAGFARAIGGDDWPELAAELLLTTEAPAQFASVKDS